MSRRTIYNRIREGKLQTIRTIGGSQRVLLSSLDENRRPVWSTASSDPMRDAGSVVSRVQAHVASEDDVSDDLEPFTISSTHTDPRNRQES